MSNSHIQKTLLALILLLPALSATAQNPLIGKTWEVYQYYITFNGESVHLYHSDSDNNHMDMSELQLEYFDNGLYKSGVKSDPESEEGSWEINESEDSIIIDGQSNYLVQLDDANYITRTWSLEIADLNGTLDTAYHYFHLTPDGVVTSTAPAKSAADLISIFPNPSVNEINISLNQKGITLMKVLNVQGNEIKSLPFNQNEETYTVNVNELSQGIYILEFWNNQNEQVATKRFVKI